MKYKFKKYFINFKEKIKRHLGEVVSIKKSPHSIAAGFAIGTLIAVLPTFGLGIFIGLLVLLIFKRVSKISMFISFALWNPFILALLYPVSYSIGNLIFRKEPVKIYDVEILNNIFVYSRRFLLGSLVLSVTLAIASYLLILILVYRYHHRNLQGFKQEVRKLGEIIKP
jgi:hypothetical protein